MNNDRNYYRAITLFILAGVLVCVLILWHRHHQEKTIEQSVHAADRRLAEAQARGIPSDRMDNLFADADQILCLQRGMIEQSNTIPIRMDPSIRRVVLMAMADASACQITLRQPNGQMINAKSPGVFQPTVKDVQVLEVKNPAPGDWRLTVETHDEVQIEVRAESPTSPISMEHVDIVPSSETSKVSSSVGDLHCCATGQSAESMVGVRGPLLTQLTVDLVAINGLILRTMKPESQKTTPRSLKGEYDYILTNHFSFPGQPFYVVLEGLENGQYPIRRFSSELFEPISYRSD